ncbi:sodium:solute symporter [Bacteroidia bacterium]|nr:sodium:solute symporter [Bacteroidia bacterium]MDC1395255.1 sodium:solute symporter [Bacteroidia bacterium]MDC1395272.1 sodium:solute symporter [Bacteroidia bacterium]
MRPEITLAILLGYFAILIFVSRYTSKDADESSFYTGNRKSPWFLVAFGMIGASLSGVTFLSVPGAVANSHFGYFQVVMGYMVGYLIIALVLLPLYYRLKLTSIYTYLESRFGNQTYKTGAAYFLLSRIIGASFRLFLIADVLHLAIFGAFDLPYWVTLAVTIALIFAYTSKSGIKTVVYTDALQTFFLLASVVLTIIFIINKLGWTWAETFTNLASDPNTQIFHFEGNDGNVFWKQFLGGAFIALAMTGLDQDMMQKNLSISNIKGAQKNIYVQMGMFLVVNIVFLSLGALLYQYAAAFNITDFDKPDQLFTSIAMRHSIPMVGGFFIIGLVAAAYSSADSALTALTTSFCVDFLGFERNGKGTNLRTRRIVHVTFAVILFFTVLLFKELNNDSVINELFRVAGFTYGPLLGLFAFGILTKRRFNDNHAIVITLVSILLTAAYCYILPNKLEGFKPGFEVIIVNGVITFFFLYIDSLTTKKSTT